jgi:hypothetical protein
MLFDFLPGASGDGPSQQVLEAGDEVGIFERMSASLHRPRRPEGAVMRSSAVLKNGKTALSTGTWGLRLVPVKVDVCHAGRQAGPSGAGCGKRLEREAKAR